MDISFSKNYFRIRKLHTKIILAFAILLFLVLLAVLFGINSILTTRATDEVRRSLDTGSQLFNFINEGNNQRLTESASILAADFAFRKAIATSEHDTILSVLNNHGSRFKASAMFLVNTDHRMVADTLGLTKPDQIFPFSELLKIAEREGKATSIVLLNNQLYQVVVVPVLAPATIAWLASGFVIDQNYARNLQAMTGLEISFLADPQGTTNWNLFGTTLSPQQAKVLQDVLPKSVVDAHDNVIELKFGQEKFLSRTLKLSFGNNTTIVGVLQLSLSNALKSLQNIKKMLLVLSMFSFLAALVASTHIARNITTPIRRLGLLAKRVEQGDYSQSIVADREDEIGQLFAAFNHMSSGIADREAKIIELAYRDSLTGLPNRFLFNDRLAQAVKATKRNGPTVAIMLMDLDRFKDVNDILGHHVGDLLLQEVAKRLKTVARRANDTVSRLGGDEFAILMATNAEGAQIVANNILNAFVPPILLENQEIIMKVSIGISYCPGHSDEASTLLRQADLAMYSAKRNNEGFVVFDPILDQYKQQHLSLMSELYRAIEREELTLYYQPKVDLASGTISHVEALIRWLHPEKGFVPPDQFIPFAEHTGFIRVITLWVIKKALLQQKMWQEMGLAITVSINISARDLFIRKFPALIADLINECEVDIGYLIMEITESAIMADPHNALNVLNELRDMGLRLSIDDFGTGYSSLSYLKKLPVSELKIDKSFVFNMINDKDDAVIVRSTIDLAHNMGLSVVAEGVENQATWAKLEELNCDFLQGYYISRPLPPQDLLTWAETSQWNLPSLFDGIKNLS